MKNKTQEELNELFNRFANETQASSFAVENLFNKVIKIMQKEEREKDKTK